MEKEKGKLGAFAYIVGGLSYIPLIGVLFGIVAVTWGLVTKKLGGKKLAFMGAGGMAFTVLIYSSLFYFGFVQRGGVYDEVRAQLAKANLTTLVQSIEFYKTQSGKYPASLDVLAKSLPEGSMVFLFDPAFNLSGDEARYFHYQLVDKDHYYLLSVGADGQPFTNDDILPAINVGPNSGVGLLFNKQ